MARTSNKHGFPAVVFYLIFGFAVSANVVHAQTLITSFTANPSYSPGNCITNYNGWGGSDSFLVTVPNSGLYFVDNLQASGSIWGGSWAIADPASYDLNVSILDQALAYGSVSDNARAAPLMAGQQVLVVLYYSGGYPTVPMCEGDGFGESITGDLMFRIPPPASIPGLSTIGFWLLTGLMLGLAMIRLARR